MAESGIADSLTDETRQKLDELERGTADVERQIRAATVALEDKEKEAETRAADQPDAERRERIQLRSKASLTGYLRAVLSGRRPYTPEIDAFILRESRSGATIRELAARLKRSRASVRGRLHNLHRERQRRDAFGRRSKRPQTLAL